MRWRRHAIACAGVTAALLAAAPVAAAADPTLAAAGDIACGTGNVADAADCHQQQTSDLVLGMSPTAVAVLGDEQYPDATTSDFDAFYDPSWGRLKSLSEPVPGNHEYHTAGAAGYFGYFGDVAGDPAEGWYSYDLGSWHLVALNSNCSAAACDGSGTQASDAELTWLAQDLDDHPADCTLAYWHHPLFASGIDSEDAGIAPLWRVLDDHGADVVLNGHIHHFERYAPQDASGVATAAGVREFLVGTGGRSLSSPVAPGRPTDEALDFGFGALLLTLHADGYDWRFEDEAGIVLDSGSAPCDPPLVGTGAATGVAGDAATLQGTVTPGTQDGTYHFEYGTTTGYGATTPERSLPAGGEPVSVTATVGGLAPGTAYHFRLVATVPGGDTAGADASFTTVAAAPSPTPTPTPSPAPAPVPAPVTVPTATPSAVAPHPGRLRLRVPDRRVRHGVVRVRIACRSKRRCAGTLRLTARLGARSTRIGRRAFSLRAGASRTVAVRLSQRARSALARHSLRVTVSGRPRAQRAWTASPLHIRLARRR